MPDLFTIPIPGEFTEPYGPEIPEARPLVPTDLARLADIPVVLIETESGGGEYEPAPNFLFVETSLWLGLKGWLCTIEAKTDIQSLVDGQAAPGQPGTQGGLMSELIEEFAGHRRVRIVTPGRILFEGYPQTPGFTRDAQSQQFTMSLLATPYELLRTSRESIITGRTYRFDPTRPWDPGDDDLVDIETDPPDFNAAGNGNREPDFVPVDTSIGDLRIHYWTTDAAPTAERWTYAQALRWVVYRWIVRTGLPIDARDFFLDTQAVALLEPGATVGDPFLDRMATEVRGVSVRSVDAETAIALLCKSARLEYHIKRADADPFGEGADDDSGGDLDPPQNPIWKLRIFAPLDKDAEEGELEPIEQGHPVFRDIPQGEPFADLTQLTFPDTLAKIKANRATITVDKRAITRPLFYGGRRRYEISVFMRPGWAPFADLDNVEDTDAAQEAAYKVWDVTHRLGSANANRTGPDSKFHRAHPDHGKTAVGSNPATPHSDIGRLWVLPMDTRYRGLSLARAWPDTAFEPEEGEETGQFLKAAAYEPILEDEREEFSFYFLQHQFYGADLKAKGPLDDGGFDDPGSRDWTVRSRPFFDTISAVDASRTRAPLVEVAWFKDAIGDEAGEVEFVKLTSPIEFDPETAALSILIDDLFELFPEGRAASVRNSIIGHIIRQQFYIRVTASVYGDDRMIVEPDGATIQGRALHKAIDTGENRFLYRRRDMGNSVLFDPTDFTVRDEEFSSRDDQVEFEEFANQQARFVGVETVAGDFSVPFLDVASFQLGDLFTGVAGWGWSFDSYPALVGVRIRNQGGAGLQTSFVLSDLRSVPDSGER